MLLNVMSRNMTAITPKDDAIQNHKVCIVYLFCPSGVEQHL